MPVIYYFIVKTYDSPLRNAWLKACILKMV